MLLAIAVTQNGRSVEVAGGDAAVLMALEMNEVARRCISTKAGLGDVTDSLIHCIWRERYLACLLGSARQSIQEPDKQDDCNKDDPGSALEYQQAIVVSRHMARRCLDTS